MSRQTVPPSPGNPADITVNDDATCIHRYHAFKARAAEALAAFRAAGIPDRVYHDTMSDIDVWAEDYRRRHGHYGIREAAWIEKSLTMKVFKLGRLQFERLEGDDASALLAAARCGKDTLALNTHIQAGTTLDDATCEASFQAAGPFYTRLGFVFSRILFACSSWLLNPLLRDLLPPGSNILRFQNRFTMISSNPDSRQMEERVFGTLRGNPADYPGDNTLQRNLREALIQGRNAGTAKGVFIR